MKKKTIFRVIYLTHRICLFFRYMLPLELLRHTLFDIKYHRNHIVSQDFNGLVCGTYNGDTKSLGLYQYFSQRWRWRSRGGDLFQSDMVSNKNFWVLKLDFVKNVILFSELVPFKLGSRINILYVWRYPTHLKSSITYSFVCIHYNIFSCGLLYLSMKPKCVF